MLRLTDFDNLPKEGSKQLKLETAGELKTSIDPESIPGLSNLIQPRARNCQLSLLTDQKSVANVNYNRSLPLPCGSGSGRVWREEKTKSQTVKN